MQAAVLPAQVALLATVAARLLVATGGAAAAHAVPAAPQPDCLLVAPPSRVPGLRHPARLLCSST